MEPVTGADQPVKAKRFWLKPLLASLLVLVIVTMAAVAPGLLLQLQDKQLFANHHPLQPRGGTLADEEAGLYSVYAIRQLGGALNEQASEFTIFSSPDEAAPYIEKCFTQITDMINQGLILEYIGNDLSAYLTPSTQECAARTIERGNYRFEQISVDNMGALGNNYACSFVIDSETGKAVTMSLLLPNHYFENLENYWEATGTIMEDHLHQYIQWLELDTITDWNFGNSLPDASYNPEIVSCHSPSAGISLWVSYEIYPESINIIYEANYSG